MVISLKKFFQIIGLISLTIFSFFITDKTVSVVNNLDEIMIEIKANKDKLTSEAIDAIIDEKTIIPGINGKRVNINKSYKNMKKNGYYNEKLYIYDYIKPKISLDSNLDKYIIKGNPNKRMISLIFKVENNDNIENIVSTLNNYDAKSTFFIDEEWLNKNSEYVKKLIDDGHTVNPLFETYENAAFEWMDTVIKKASKKSYGFCYNTDENEKSLNACKLKNDYTIKPIEINEVTPLVDIKNKLEPGSLITLKNNSQLKKELSSIIIYIKSKGYSITNLEKNVLE